MFSWIKNLKKNSGKNDAAAAQGSQQTRVVKRIVPASAWESAATAVATPPPLPTPVAVAAPIPIAHEARIPISTAPAAHAPAPAPRPRKPTPIAFPGTLPTTASFAPSLVEDEPEPEAPPAKPAPIRLATSTRTTPRVPTSGAPAVTKEIILTIGDFVSKIPGHFINEAAVNRNLEVHFAAEDLYSDMTKGRATVPLSIIAENVPGIFRRQLSAEEDIEIQLPLPKIVAQMSEFLTRRDQEEAESYNEIDTPFSKAAQRDGAVHKTSGAVAPIPAAPAPVETAPPPPESFRPKLKPISFKPAQEPAAPEPPPPVVRPPAPEPVIPRLAPAPALSSTRMPGVRDDGRRVTVRVRPLIQALPMAQRESLLGSIPEDSLVDLPLAEIEEQLPNGRVVLPFSTFAAALKPELRSTFTSHYTGEDVPISLSEIVKNLPRESFNLRRDQVVEEVDPNEFETPFNTTPNEIPKPASAAQPQVAHAPAVRARPVITPTVAAPVSFTTRKLNTDTTFPSPMHAALATHETLDAKKIVKLASALPGVASMTIITDDGLSLAGNLPAFMNPDGFTAMAPQLRKRVAGLARDMKLGELQHLTLFTDTQTVTILTSGTMSLAVLHQNQADFGHGVREKLVAIVNELEKQYTH